MQSTGTNIVDPDEIEAAINKAADKIEDRLRDKIDRDFVEKDLNKTMLDLQKRQEEGNLTLEDLRSMLLVSRNVLVPAAIKGEIDRLRAIAKQAALVAKHKQGK